GANHGLEDPQTGLPVFRRSLSNEGGREVKRRYHDPAQANRHVSTPPESGLSDAFIVFLPGAAGQSPVYSIWSAGVWQRSECLPYPAPQTPDPTLVAQPISIGGAANFGYVPGASLFCHTCCHSTTAATTISMVRRKPSSVP